MIELADVLDRLLQLLIIVEPEANLGHPLTTHAELLRAPAYVTVRTNTWCPSPRAHFGQPLLCRTVRSNSEPRSNSPLIGNLLTSFRRVRRARSRIIYKNESVAATSVNLNPVRPCSFPAVSRFCPQTKGAQFCAEK
jgi:hypothetical protein